MTSFPSESDRPGAAFGDAGTYQPASAPSGAQPTWTTGGYSGVTEPGGTDQRVAGQSLAGNGRVGGEGSYASDGSKAEVAKQEAVELKDAAVESAGQVAQVAKEEAVQVASEVAGQARGLLDQARSELSSQAGSQQQLLASSLHGWAKELGAMAAKSDESGPVTDLARQAARQGGEVAHWLENHEPADVLEQVTSFARRRPLTFLALSAAAGIVVGRLTRSAVAANTEVDSPQGSMSGSRSGPAAIAPSSGPSLSAPTPVPSPTPVYAATVPAPTYETGMSAGPAAAWSGDVNR